MAETTTQVKSLSEIKQLIRQFIPRLQPEVRVEKVVLFGSYLNGEPDEWSDVDIAVISNDFGKFDFWEQARFLAQRQWRDFSLLEVHPYTLRDYRRASHLTFLGEIKRTGKVIYTRRKRRAKRAPRKTNRKDE
ncbi:MAG: nucleotidyltransferase domain-containing protein [Chloroflexi bacterium]|nr:nucleotidyltransferase domain-containing protein [Chloroflexota bacterium]